MSRLAHGAHSMLADLWSEPSVRIAAILLLLVPALTLLVLALLPHRGAPAPQLAEPPIEAVQAISPTTALFGDRLEARIDVLSDPSVDAASVRVLTDFRPYRVVSRSARRARQGRLTLLRTRLELDCLTVECLPSRKAPRQFRFAPATIVFREHGREHRVQQPWAEAPIVYSRLGPPSQPVQLVDRPPSLSPGFRLPPALLQTALALLAGLLALAGALLVARGLWPHFFYSRRSWRRLSPLEQALVQVEAAAAIEDEDLRRRTLEQLATRLHEAKLGSLEHEIRSAAWCARAPERDSLELLARRLRADLNGRVRR